MFPTCHWCGVRVRHDSPACCASEAAYRARTEAQDLFTRALRAVRV